MERNKSIFRDKTTSIDLHPIHLGMQRYFMVIVTRSNYGQPEIVGDITGALTKGFIKDLGAYFLEDETEFQTPITMETTTFLLHY